MHPPSELSFDLLQLRTHPLGLGLASDDEPAILPGLRAEVREAQEVEGFRFAFPFSLPVGGGVAPELDEPGLLRVQFQIEVCQSLAQLR